MAMGYRIATARTTTMAYVDSKGRTWHDFDVSTLSVEAQALYAKRAEAFRAAYAAEDAFEARANAEMKAQLQWGYRFGKLSFTAEGKPKGQSTAKPKMSLAQFLAAQNGRNA
jgi:hypothetical protein